MTGQTIVCSEDCARRAAMITYTVSLAYERDSTSEEPARLVGGIDC
jgi:hypothetical protein